MTDRAESEATEHEAESNTVGDVSRPQKKASRRGKQPRGRTGCLNCRKRRKKCDEQKPNCAKCKRFGDTCEWESGKVTFRLNGIDSAHPSMQARKRPCNVRDYQMVDVTFDSSTHRRIESRGHGRLPSSAGPQDEHGEVEMANTTTNDTNSSESLTELEAISNHIRGLSRSISPLDVRHGASHSSAAAAVGEASLDMYSSNNTLFRPGRHYSKDGTNQTHIGSLHPSVSTDSSSPNNIQSSDRVAGHELGALDYLTDFHQLQTEEPLLYRSAYAGSIPMSPSFAPILAESPDMFSMYYPNAQYHQLHTTLYNHMVETARGTGLTRQATPEAEDSETVTQEGSPSQFASSDDASAQSMPPKGMTSQREIVLWKNYMEEISIWLDIFDNDRHFQNSMPLLAHSSEPLRLSILALSARQLERRDPDKPYTESLGLYQQAIQLIVQSLQSMDTAVIASCVLLCVLEMMSSSPRDWARHLDGCAMLIKAAGINGVSGGVKQAIFWCFARMDMWGGFLTDSNTKIPTSLWFLPSGSMSAAVSRFKTDFKSFDQYANYAVFLCASVLNVISNDDKVSYTKRWKTLFDLLEDWYDNRPAEMRPLLSRTDDFAWYPFPTTLYTNPSAISGNQLYHAAALLMLQAKPRDVRIRSHKSLFWHARQICGITASNSNHGAYTNAPQPLWIAGRVLSHPSEHGVVLELLARIEKDTGFATAWRAEDLKVHWGEMEDAAS